MAQLSLVCIVKDKMPGKRRRVGDVSSDPQPTTTAATTATSGKPLSAIAAARLRAEAVVRSVAAPEPLADPVPVLDVASPLPQSPVAEPEDSEQGEEPLVFRQNVKLCTWRNEPQNVMSDTDKELTVKLNKHTTIALVGCFHFRVLRGAINVNGANIGAVSRHGQQDHIYTAHVPATHPISKFRGLDGTNHVQFLHCEESNELASIGPLFEDIWAAGAPSFSVLTESDADVHARPLGPESCPEDWLRAVEDCAADSSIVVVFGASATGKSTFARRLLNRYLTGQGKSARSLPAVCYLDLDPMRPEYTTPGQISLVVVRSLNFGPSFTHPATPLSPSGLGTNETLRSHCIPANLVNYRDYYRACVEDLFLAHKSLQSQDPLLPLIVNTPGSLYASDFDLLTTLLARIKPHHTVHLGDVHAINTEQATRLHSLQAVVTQYRGTVHDITAQSPPSLPMRTDAQTRAMHMQSYFHLNWNKLSQSTTTTTWSSSPVSGLVPWEFCYSETDERVQDFVGFAMYSEPIEPESLLSSLNGSVVQIIESTSSAIPTPYIALSRTKRHQLPFFDKFDRTGIVEPLDPQTSKMICTALVRGFDLERRLVQVLVPRSHEALLYNLSPERTVLVSGCCDPPEWAYLEDMRAVDRLTGREYSSLSNAGSKPWVEERTRMDDMGYLSTVRRVRKFQT